MDTGKLEARLKEHEGFNKFAYNDSLGFSTIGYGRCIDRRKGKGISDQEATYLLRNDISECAHLMALYPWYSIQDNVRKCVLIELCFNLGLQGLLGFKNTLAAMLEKDYVKAAEELLDSRWAKQVSKSRSDDIVYRLVHGAYKA